LAIIE
jgi:tetratricopeptide (TPR) repeat protein